MKLNLERPIAFFDLETTGINVATDRIVEISIVKVHPNGTEQEKTYKVNPECLIPEEVSKIHGIYDEDVKDAPTFKELASELYKFIYNCDLAGYNSNRFDVPLLAEEFLRAGVDFDVDGIKLVDVQNVFHKMEKRTLEAAYQFYCDKTLENAHSASADTNATYQILKAQLDKYDNLQNNVDFLSEFTTMNRNADLLGRFIYNNDNEIVFNFGKHKGKTIENVLKKEPFYYNWMMKGDFPLSTKKVLKKVKENLE